MLHDVLTDIHSVEKHQRDETFERGSKCTDLVLATEEILRCTNRIELMK